MNHKKIVRQLLAWFERNARDLPWRRTRDPYAIWVSEVMLQQTQVKTVLPYWVRWMQALPNVQALARARPQKIHKLWEGLGYYTRVRNLQKAAQIVLAEHAGEFPEQFEDVLALPGIGRYTAGAICSIAFNQSQPILDGNVTRVLSRLFGVSGNPRARKTNARLWRIAEDLVRCAALTPITSNQSPIANHYAPPCSPFNQSLMELGAMVCTPRRPLCGLCPVASDCVARKEGRVHRLPTVGRPRCATPRRCIAFVVEKGGRFLVRQRPSSGLNAHLWEFPTSETEKPGSRLNGAARSVLGTAPAKLEPLCTIKHAITRYRITMKVFRARVSNRRNFKAAAGQWLTRRQMAHLPLASAQKRILALLNRP